MRSHANETLILAAYPLSASFDQALKTSFGKHSRVVTAAQLRTQNVFGLLRLLWGMRGDPIALPIEESNSTVLLPVLKLLAACTRSRSICVVHPDLSRETVSRWRIAWDMVGFIGASAICLWEALRAKRELVQLLARNRIPMPALPAGGAVLYLKTNLWFGIKAGGSVGHIAGVVNGLQRAGYPVIFASAEPPVMIDSEVRQRVIEPPATFGLPYELNNYRFQRRFEKKLASDGAMSDTRLIYQRLSAANYLGTVLSRRYELPLVVEYNGSEVWIAKNWGRGMSFHHLAGMAEDVMLRHAHLVVTVSDVLRDELIERGVERTRIISYPNCIDPEVFDPNRFGHGAILKLRNHLNIPPDSFVVTFIGTFGQWHGADKLAHAIAYMHTEQRAWLTSHRLRFLFVGDGLTRQKVERIISDAGANTICTFAGLVPQAQAPLHLAASNVLVSPHIPNADGSRFFGSPTKLFEYMAMGKPILASDLDQIGEVLRPGLNVRELPARDPTSDDSALALLHEPGNINEMLSGLRYLVERPKWCALLGRNARAMALNRYTWEIHVKEILDGIRRQTIAPGAAKGLRT